MIQSAIPFNVMNLFGKTPTEVYTTPSNLQSSINQGMSIAPEFSTIQSKQIIEDTAFTPKKALNNNNNNNINSYTGFSSNNPLLARSGGEQKVSGITNPFQGFSSANPLLNRSGGEKPSITNISKGFSSANPYLNTVQNSPFSNIIRSDIGKSRKVLNIRDKLVLMGVR